MGEILNHDNLCSGVSQYKQFEPQKNSTPEKWTKNLRKKQQLAGITRFRAAKERSM